MLYLVGTPIGNLGDLSSRAAELLKKVSVIACEDTRRSYKLTKKIGVFSKLLSFHQHNTQTRIPELLEFLEQGKSIALISDAGLPGISDPGEELVIATKKAGFEVICIPGPCAAITALVASGMSTKRFCFEGFLPIKTNERKKILEQISHEERTIILYESPHRLVRLLEELSSFCEKGRLIHLARELTKRYEEHLSLTIAEAIEHFNEKKPQGEFTIIISGKIKHNSEVKSDLEMKDEILELISKGIRTSEAIKKVAKENDYSKRLLYNLIHQNINSDL